MNVIIDIGAISESIRSFDKENIICDSKDGYFLWNGSGHNKNK